MPYNSQIQRTDADTLVPPEVSREIIQAVPQSSSFLQMARRLPNMSRNQLKLPVLSALMTAYFVNGDTGMKQTSNLSWNGVYITAEELAVIVPIPENVLDDQDYDIWGEIQPRMIEAFGKAIDQAAYFGTNAPVSWPSGITIGAAAAGNSVHIGSVGADLYDDLMAEGGVFNLTEIDGFDITGAVAPLGMKAKLRGLRDADGNPILRSMAGPQAATTYELDGNPITFPRNGAMDPTQAWLIAGQWDQAVYSIRTDVTYKLLDQAVITDNSSPPVIIYNLPQQDMIALRATLRLGWQLPNPVNPVQPIAANRYPFGVLTP